MQKNLTTKYKIRKKIYFDFIIKVQKKLDKINNQKILLKVKSKKKRVFDPVTNLDQKIENFLKKIINEKFPDDTIISEESKTIYGKSDYTWYIDPVDGTKNYLLNLPTWSNLIGLYYKDTCILSFVNFPILKKFYVAINEKNYIFQNNRKRKIILKKNNFRFKSILINTFNTLKNKKVYNFLKNYKGLFKITGSDAYNYCLMCEGKSDVFIETNVKKIDINPLVLLIKNANLQICDWNGKLKLDSGKILITNNLKNKEFFLKLLKSNN